MARLLVIMAATSWLTLAGGPSAVAEPPTASNGETSEAAKPRIVATGLPAPTTSPAAGTEPPPAAATDAEAAPAAEANTVQPVKEVTLDPAVKPPVCRRYVPTGSRIATEVCQSAEVADTVRAAERDQTRRDIDEMRMRQAMRDAARAAAQAEAMRRRAGF
jgi:hypothetical protein